MFPERQYGPHRDWKLEVEYLDSIFERGAAYTVGKVNGDHWLLYITNPPHEPERKQDTTLASGNPFHDYTVEILMSDLSPSARGSFFYSSLSSEESPASRGHALSSNLGITDIFPSQFTTLDAYSFTPCGYSSNALIRWGGKPGPQVRNESPDMGHSEGYFTIHVTPEEGWSYASFECNVPLSLSPVETEEAMIPDLTTLIQRVVSVFQPRRLSLTLFVSRCGPECDENAVEAAQKAFRNALTTKLTSLVTDDTDVGNSISQQSYRRTDKINYEFGGYDLAFATFEL